VHVGESPPLGRELVDIRRLYELGAVAAQVPVPDVVGEDKDHVRAITFCRRISPVRPGSGSEQENGENDANDRDRALTHRFPPPNDEQPTTPLDAAP
jgi:hypothetical protein